MLNLSSHTVGIITEPETDWSERKMIHIIHTNVPSEVILLAADDEITWTYITSISPVQQDALFAFQEATTTLSADLLQSHEQGGQQSTA